MFKLLPLLLSFSLSMRSPNITPNPMDYEIAWTVQKADTAYIDLQFERENGREYFDKETWLKKTFGKFSIKDRYLEKESRSIRFNQLDMRYNHKGWSAGYGLKHYGDNLAPSHNLVAGWKSKDINYDILIAQLKLSSFVDMATNFDRLDISTNTQAAFRLNAWENISLAMLVKYERLGDDFYYQFKTTINLELK